MVRQHTLNACLWTILFSKLKTLELIFPIMGKYMYNNTKIQLIALKKNFRLQKGCTSRLDFQTTKLHLTNVFF